MKLDWAIRELHRSERDLQHELLQISERHAADHEVFHVGRDLAAWSGRHVRDLSEIGKDYDLDLDPDGGDTSSIMEKLREQSSALLGRRPEPALLKLRDLRELYMKAAGVSLDWDMLGQAAQAAKQRELLALSKRCHPETLRQMRWADSQLKISSTQALVS